MIGVSISQSEKINDTISVYELKYFITGELFLE